MSSQTQESQQATAGSAKEARQKANERLGQWVNRKYCIESLLGVGGMATVFAARHRNGSRVALKIMHAEFAREEGVKKRFLREGYVANKVDHPGVVSILDDDETDDGEPYLVMELLEGETLQQLWKRRQRKVPVPEALHIAEQVLDTLGPFHELNIIHRDLKPANIFICGDGPVKLLDFGVAQLREKGGEAMTRAGTALGTPSFMSPEQAMGKSDQLDGRSDIFSVGATLYACLSGKRLHHGKSDNEAFILAATQPAPSLARTAPDLDVEVIALVDRALQWDRRKRFRTAADMRDECRRLLGAAQPEAAAPEVAPAAEPAPPPQAPSRPQRHRSAAEMPVPSAPVHAPAAAVQDMRVASPAAGPVQPHAPPVGPTPAYGMQISQQPPPAPAPSAPAPQVVSQAPQPPVPQPALPPPPPAQQQQQQQLRPPPAEEEEQAPELLKDVFDRMDRALPAMRQYGIDHPEGQRGFKAIFRAVVDALRAEPDGMVFQIHPFCITRGRALLWEPNPPLDLIPYNLAKSGLEEVQMLAGVSERELHDFLAAMLLDPSADEDSDIAAALWEARFLYIKCKIRDDLTEADAAEQMRFFAEADDLEALAREDLAEAAAMAVATDKGSFDMAGRASTALEIDQASKAALGAQLSLEPDNWRERFHDFAVDALADAQSREDLDILLKPMSDHAWIIAKRARYEELFGWRDVLLNRLSTHREAQRYGVTAKVVTKAVFPFKVVKLLVESALGERISNLDRDRILQDLPVTLEALDGAYAVQQLQLGDEIFNPFEDTAKQLSAMLIDNAEAHVSGNEKEIVELLDDLNPELAQRILAAITATRTPEAIELLKPLLMSKNPALRCEATALLSKSPEQLGKQLLHVLGSSDERLRSAALTTMVRHNVRPAGPGLVRVIEAEGFNARSHKEQEQMFDALYALNPPRAESPLTSIVSQHGMLADEQLDQARAAAASALGKHADSANPVEALESAARRRPWNTQNLRLAAGAAVEAISARLRGDAAATGGGPQ